MIRPSATSAPGRTEFPLASPAAGWLAWCMKKSIPAFLLCIGLLASCDPEGTGGERPDTLVSEYDQSEMDQAIATARSRIDEFLAALEKGGADMYSVKAPITDANGTEHFWLTDVNFENGVFTGAVGNDPGIVENVEFGQSWSVKKDEISDWMYTVGEKIHGGFTIDPLLGSFPEEEAEAMRARLVR